MNGPPQTQHAHHGGYSAYGCGMRLGPGRLVYGRVYPVVDVRVDGPRYRDQAGSVDFVITLGDAAGQSHDSSLVHYDVSVHHAPGQHNVRVHYYNVNCHSTGVVAPFFSSLGYMGRKNHSYRGRWFRGITPRSQRGCRGFKSPPVHTFNSIFIRSRRMLIHEAHQGGDRAGGRRLGA